MSALGWLPGHTHILIVDGATTSYDVETEAMRSADTVACVTVSGTVNVVKHRTGRSAAMTPAEWERFVVPYLRRGAQVIKVDAEAVRREVSA
jgi:hypothetical protein